MQRYTEPWPPWVLGIRTISSAHLCQNHKQIPHFWNLHRQGSFLCCFSCFCCGCRWPSSRCLWIWRKIGADVIDLRKRQGELVLEHGDRGVHGSRELQQRFTTITSSASTSSSVYCLGDRNANEKRLYHHPNQPSNESGKNCTLWQWFQVWLAVSTKVTLDANWRWIHEVSSNSHTNQF